MYIERGKTMRFKTFIAIEELTEAIQKNYTGVPADHENDDPADIENRYRSITGRWPDPFKQKYGLTKPDPTAGTEVGDTDQNLSPDAAMDVKRLIHLLKTKYLKQAQELQRIFEPFGYKMPYVLDAWIKSSGVEGAIRQMLKTIEANKKMLAKNQEQDRNDQLNNYELKSDYPAVRAQISQEDKEAQKQKRLQLHRALMQQGPDVTPQQQERTPNVPKGLRMLQTLQQHGLDKRSQQNDQKSSNQPNSYLFQFFNKPSK
jgi:hypothetical protein